MLPFAPQTLPRGFRDEEVFAAMERVPRAAFVPDGMRGDAHRNIALPIGCGQTISQPLIVAYMTAGLAVRAGDRVLEVGTGSGYQAAILAALGVEVFSIEMIAELSERAASALRQVDLDDTVHLRVGDGWHGWPAAAPFDGVICTAAPERTPPALIEQLVDGRRLVIPIGPAHAQQLRVFEKSGGEMHEIDQLGVRFVPLVRAAVEG